MRPGDVRTVRPVRDQVQFVPQTLDELLPEDHPARAIWGLLEQLDLGGFYAEIAALVDGPGRPATDPQVLLAVWLLATAEGIGSARQVARLCTEHAAYRWLCGGVPVNYHTLSDFRVGRQAQLDDLVTQILASLLAARLVTLQQVAQTSHGANCQAAAPVRVGHAMSSR
jgi:transposase